MDKIQDPYLQERIPQNVSEISEKLAEMPESLLVLVDGKSGSGKDFLIDKTLDVFNQNSATKVCKSKSKKSTRPPRVGEKTRQSRSGTEILSEEHLRDAENLIEYEFSGNKYAVDLEKLQKELQENKIVFLPIADLVIMNDTQQAIVNFVSMQKAIRKQFPDTKTLNISIKRNMVSAIEGLQNRVESSIDEVKDRIKYHETGSDRIYRQALVNKGYIKEIINNTDHDSDPFDGVNNILLDIKECLGK